MEEADVVSAHNGDRFDLTVFNTRLLAHGLKPVPPSKSLDTKKIAKNKFHLPSNKLDDIADFLGIGHKLETHKSMWFGCEKGDKKDWKLMKEYCGKDVLLQEKVLDKILPFTRQLANWNVIMDELRCCPNPSCGSERIQKRGFHYSATAKTQRIQCQDCGTWSQSSLKAGSIVR